MKSPRRRKTKRVARGGGSPTNRRKRRSRSPPRRDLTDHQEPSQRKMLVARRTTGPANAFPLLPRTPQQAAEHKRRMSVDTLAEEQKLRQITSKSTVNDEAVFLYPPELHPFLPDSNTDNNNLAYQAWYGGSARRRRRNSKR